MWKLETAFFIMKYKKHYQISTFRASSNRKGPKNRKIGIHGPRK